MITPTPRSPDVGIYVYCVAQSTPLRDRCAFSSPAIGGEGRPVHTVEFMDLSAVVSDSPPARYDVSRANMLAHQHVVEEVMGCSDVLPVRFGTIARSIAEVEDKLLRRRFGELHGLLHSVQGRVELGLKVFWNRERMLHEIADESAQIRALRDAIAARPPESTHYDRIKLGELIEREITRKRDQEAEATLAPLRPLAMDVRVNKILTDTMVLNAAFLVDKQRESLFDAAVNRLDEPQLGRLVVKYVGPVPPYNFVSLIVQWGD